MTESSRTGASEYIERLLKNGELLMTPDVFKGLPVSKMDQLQVEGGIMQGYQANVGIRGESFIEMNNVKTLSSGKYRVAFIGVPDGIKFPTGQGKTEREGVMSISDRAVTIVQKRGGISFGFFND